MDDHIQFWLESAENPPDFYQLLGRQCLDPDRRELQRAASAAYQTLHRYQTHSDSVIVRRARTLQDEVARAAGILGDESAWTAYEQSQMERLAAGYSEQLQNHPAAAGIDSVADWLRDRGDVHPDRIAELAEAISSQLASPGRGEAIPAAEASARQRSSRLFSRTPVLPVPQTGGSEQTPDRSAGGGNPPPKPPPRKKLPPDRKLPSIDEALVAAPVVMARPAPRAPVPAVTAPARRPRGNVPVAAAGGQAQAASHLWMLGAAAVSAVGLVAIVGGILLVHSWARPAPDRSLVDTSTSSATPVERWRGALPDDEEFDSPDATLREPVSTESREEPSPPDAGDEPGPDEDVEETSAGSPTETGTTLGNESSEDAAPPPEETTPAAEESDPAPPQEDNPAATTGHGGIIIRNDSPAQCVAWSPDGTRVACGTSDGTIRICSADTGDELQQLLGHTDAVLALAWHPGGNLLASAGVDGTVHVWKPEDGTETSLAGDAIAVNCIAWLPDSMDLAAGNSSGSLRRLSLRNISSRRREELDAGQPAGAVRALDVLEDRSGETIVSLHFDGSLLFWAWNRDEPVRGILPVSSGLFAGLSATGAVLPSENVTPSGYTGGADLAVNSSGQNIAVALGGPIRLWNIEHGACAVPGRLLCGRGDVNEDEVPDGYGTVAWSGDDRLLAAGDATGRVSCWDTTTWTLLFFAHCPARINDTAWNPADPDVLAIACDDNTVRIYDMSGRTRAVSLDSDPMFQRSALITEADAFLADDEMPSLRLVVDVLAMYHVDAATEQALHRYRYELRQAAVALLNGMPADSLPGNPRMPDWNLMLDLHQIMYLDPDGPSGEEARAKLLELFGVRHVRSRGR